MKAKYFKTTVIENTQINSEIFRMTLEDHREIRAGQFYMLKPKSAFLGRPISVSEVHNSKVDFVYAVVGDGTNYFKGLKSGDEIEIIGPLGNGFNVDMEHKKVALVSGGIGVAPMLELSKKLKETGKYENIDLFAGFRDESYLLDKFAPYVNNIWVATDSGMEENSVKGFVTDILIPENYDVVLCCGPEIMMKKVIEMCKKVGVPIYVSMEKHMACGVGACLVCTCKTKEGNKRTCKDGPVFNGYDVEL